MIDWPDPFRLGIEVITRAAASAAWDEDWRALTGLSWAEWQERRNRYRPEPLAHLSVKVDHERPVMSRVTVTRPGLLACDKVRIDVSAADRSGVRFWVPLSQVTQE